MMDNQMLRKILDMGPEELTTPGQVAEALDTDPKTVTRWCQSGKWVQYRDWVRLPGGHRRIFAAAVHRIYQPEAETKTEGAATP